MANISHEGPGLAASSMEDPTLVHRPQSEVGAEPKHRILVVEDSPVVRLYLKHTLERPQMGCRVDLAADGLEALEALQRNCYDLIICDLNMPNMDGRAFCRSVRARPCDCLQRIVIFTSDYHCRLEPQFSGDPAILFLQKPASAEEIQGLMLHVLA